MPSLAHNPRLLALFQVSKMALFPVAILPLYMAGQCALSLTEVMWLQSLFGLVVALAEFPSGYLADRIGYRRMLLLGSWLVAAGWSIYPVAHDFWSLLAGEVVLGLGFASISGCDSALLYESLHAQGRSERFGKLFARQHSWGLLAEGTAALSAGFLYALHPQSPFWSQVAITLLMVAIVSRMCEPVRQARRSSGSHLVHARDAVLGALRAQPRLRALLGLWTVLSLASYLPVWLFAPYAREAGVPVSWIGPLWAASNYLVAAGAMSASSLTKRWHTTGAMLVALGAMLVGYGGLSLSHALMGCTFYFAICWMRGLVTALLTPEEHALIPSSDRAALISFRSMLFRLSFFVVGPATGALVESHGFHVTFAIAGPVLLALSGVCVLPALSKAAVKGVTQPARLRAP